MLEPMAETGGNMKSWDWRVIKKVIDKVMAYTVYYTVMLAMLIGAFTLVCFVASLLLKIAGVQ